MFTLLTVKDYEENRRLEDHAEDLPRRFIWLPHLTDQLSVFRSPEEQHGSCVRGGQNVRCSQKPWYNPVVPPKKNRIDPWEYDRMRYKRRNEVERFFRRIKRFRRVFTRYDKLDIVFAGFILFAMIFDSLV